MREDIPLSVTFPVRNIEKNEKNLGKMGCGRQLDLGVYEFTIGQTPASCM